MLNKTWSSVAIIHWRYFAEVLLKKIGVIIHGNKTYCKANKSFDGLKNENIKYNKRMGFKVTTKEKTTTHNVLNCQNVLISLQHLKYVLQSKFVNLPPRFLSSCTPELKIFIKMLNSYQIITLWVLWNAGPSFSH